MAISTDMAGPVPTDVPEWVGVEWTGMAQTISNVQMTVKGPSGAVVEYPDNPAHGDWTSLWYDDQLLQGERDVAKFLLDASDLGVGDHRFDVTLTYTRGGSPATISGVVTVVVEA